MSSKQTKAELAAENHHLRRAIRRLRAALEPFAETEKDNKDGMCHRGLVTARNCSHCGPRIDAQDALLETSQYR